MTQGLTITFELLPPEGEAGTAIRIAVHRRLEDLRDALLTALRSSAPDARIVAKEPSLVAAARTPFEQVLAGIVINMSNHGAFVTIPITTYGFKILCAFDRTEEELAQIIRSGTLW